MTHRFKLHAHEVWREKLVTEGVYKGSGDFADVLPEGVWEESRFVFGRYWPQKRQLRSALGHVLFRPQTGLPKENFFVSFDEVFGGVFQPHRPGQFFFDQTSELEIMSRALESNGWGRVFYLDGTKLRTEETPMPCEWGVFLSASGRGLWKWTLRDGVSWMQAERDGLFRWHKQPGEAARFLARTPSEDVWKQVGARLNNPRSLMARTRRTMETEHERRLEAIRLWHEKSRPEWEQVVHWLLLTDPELQKVNHISLQVSVVYLEGMEGELFGALFCDEKDVRHSERFQKGYEAVQAVLGPTLDGQPLLRMGGFAEGFIEIEISNPTAHERLEALLQLQAWAKERGLSFD